MKPRFGHRPPTPAELHRSWLELVDTDGPFLSVPALRRVWPQGMPQLAPNAKGALIEAKPDFERAWEAWDTARDDAAVLDSYRQARNAWIEVVLRDVLGWGAAYLTGLNAVSSDSASGVNSPDHAVTVLPTGGLVYGENVGALVLIVDPVDSLRDPLSDGWAATPIDRMEELLRHARVPIGLVTDGRWWAVVSARPKTMVASGIVDAQTWVEEPATRNAFVELLSVRRLVGGSPQDRLTEIFIASVAAAEEITLALGVQVRRAVELIVRAFSEAALDARQRGEPDPLPQPRHEVYEAGVTVMMRVVFLLFAEERGLLPQGRLFAMGYGVAGELDVLDQRARDEGAETLDATHLTWHRLLATSQALFRGASFEDLRLPSYGGSLFDPDRFGFLTARNERATLAVTVSDRVMAEVLRAVQVAELRGEAARRISFRDIDVEQIGYIYEGLLGYTCAEVGAVTIGLIGKSGEEPEIPLEVLDDIADEHTDDDSIAAAIRSWVAADQPASSPASQTALAKALRAGDQVEDAERAVLTITRDQELGDRLRSWIGAIRRDLRDRPFVVLPGGLIVVETPSRATAGAHYTPRLLAEEVVKHALEPLVYDPGPHDTNDGDAWQPISSDRILDLKVADIACGSGAFLVAAARYLAAHLVGAWQREGVATGAAHDLQIRAHRQVVASCLYGADINGMAVEMCKLSLWLVSLDPALPFSFVDDKVLHGNSLLGLTSVEQLKQLHITPGKAVAQRLFDLDRDMIEVRPLDIDDVLRRATALRRQLATEVSNDDPQRSIATKNRLWSEYQRLTSRLTHVADGVVAAGLRLGGKPGRALEEAYQNLRIAVGRAYGDHHDSAMLDGIIETGLTPTVPTDYARWQPLHWLLAVPDVIARGGFDAVIGNPPFRGGQKLTGDMGTNVRDWLVNVVADGQRGSADVVAYFFLRAFGLLTKTGTLGLIGTNTLGQGDTREVGLDRMVALGFTITRSVQSRSWPVRESASLEVALVWGTRGRVSDEAAREADGVVARRISTLLEPEGRVGGQPVRLVENVGTAFIGCYVLGMGFVLQPTEGAEWIQVDPKNAEVLFPYLNGEDLNSRPDGSASRWVIDFNDRPEREAQTYTVPYQRLGNTVKPERARKPRAVREAPWWLFLRTRPAMRKAIAGLDEVLAIALVSKTVMPLRVKTGQVFSHKLAIFAKESFVDQAALSSSPHQLWAIRYGSTMRADVNYSPSDVFLTFPRPCPTGPQAEMGKILDAQRREIMLRRQLGLTKLYNLVNDPDITVTGDRDVACMREIHVELDEAVMTAYGWDELPLDHGFHTYRQMQRWTVSPAASGDPRPAAGGEPQAGGRAGRHASGICR